MKKLITICLFMASTLTVNAQTKEETISWLKEKLTSCLELPDYYNKQLKIVSINECEFVLNYNNPQHDGSSSFHTFTIPTSNITIDSEGYIVSKLDVIKHFQSWDSTSNLQKYVGGIKIRECEADIFIRIQKALNHLATFCPKKKEAF